MWACIYWLWIAFISGVPDADSGKMEHQLSVSIKWSPKGLGLLLLVHSQSILTVLSIGMCISELMRAWASVCANSSDHVQAICEHASQEDVMGPAVRPVALRLSVTHGDMN